VAAGDRKKVLTSLQASVAPLQAQFNERRDSRKLIALLSPT
jgi:hypothetical protein